MGEEIQGLDPGLLKPGKIQGLDPCLLTTENTNSGLWPSVGTLIGTLVRGENA